MPTLTEGKHDGEFIATPGPGTISNDAGTLASGQDLVAGAVVGQITLGTPTVDADAGNTGDGVLTLADPALGANTQEGDYVITCIEAAIDAGTFRVVAPDGSVVGDATVGVAFTSSHLNFTISDGATDWAADDFITVTVPAGSGEFTELATAALDGSQRAAGVLYGSVDASAAAADCVVTRRFAEVVSAELTWPTGISDGNKSKALDQLEALGIIAR